ncbi:diaminopimelate decarboxylase [Desulfobacterota bacterium AH_259_B03_O07]|nr:diaminopimelate decarboxylase [Desulfobacterota bacterium AH_259_B03_O07]
MQNSFLYKDNEYHVEDVPVKEIVKSVGTPCYIYSASALKKSFNLYREAFSSIDPIICYSVKANSNIAILRAFARLGAGFDIVSGGELYRVLSADGDPKKIVFSGVGKTNEEIKFAILSDILFINVESIEELSAMDITAKELNKKARVAIRVNPDIDPKTHPYISTGLRESKFGIEFDKALDVYKKASVMEGIDIVGVDAHIGSQIFDLTPFADSLKKLIELADLLCKEGIDIGYIDIGGGLGISYETDDIPPEPREYADMIISELGGKEYKLVLEPGRSLIGNAGILVTKVNYLKEGETKKFVIVDAAMNDLIRPAFYDSYHEILNVNESTEDEEIVDIVGSVCESGDFFAKDRKFPKVKRDDLLAILSAGAYGFVMSSNYNSRPRVPEVMVKGEEFFIVRERETIEDLIRGENIPDFIK